MSQTVGTRKDNEIWLRCPDCGDTQRNPNKGHLSVNVSKAVFFCVRCGYSGILSPKQLFDLLARYDMQIITSTSPVELVDTEDRAGSPRFSALKRSRYTDSNEKTWDVFIVRDPVHNEQVGQYLRHEHESLIYGESGLGWVGGTLQSSADSPLRIVEGPYDVLGAQDVCCFGFLRSQALKLLKGHYVLLCPDGDVWKDEMLRNKMLKLIRWCFHDSRSPEVVGMEMLPDGKDPDECHPADRLYVPRGDLLRRVITPRNSTINLERYLA